RVPSHRGRRRGGGPAGVGVVRRAGTASHPGGGRRRRRPLPAGPPAPGSRLPGPRRRMDRSAVTPAPKVLSLAVVAIGAAARVAAGANRHATVAVRLPPDGSGWAGAVGAGRLRPSPPPAWLEAALVNAGS